MRHIDSPPGCWARLFLSSLLFAVGCGARSYPPGTLDDSSDGGGGGRPDGSRPRDGSLPDAAGRDGGLRDASEDAPSDAPLDAVVPPLREVRCELLDPPRTVNDLPPGTTGTTLVGARLGDTALLVFGWHQGDRLRMRSQQVDLGSGTPRGRTFDLGAGIPVDMASSANFANSGFAAHLLLEERPDGRYEGKILSPRGAILDPGGDPFPLDNVDPPVLALSSGSLLIAWNRADEVALSVFRFRPEGSETFTLPFADAPVRPSAAPGSRSELFRVAAAGGANLLRAEVDLRQARTRERLLVPRRVLAVRSAPAGDWELAALSRNGSEGRLVAVDQRAGRYDMPVSTPGMFRAFDATGHGDGDLLAVFRDEGGRLRAVFLHGPGQARSEGDLALQLDAAGRSSFAEPVVLPIPGTDFGYAYWVFSLVEQPGGRHAVMAERVLCPLPSSR